ncbi:MAG: DUF4116 domain-containing protein, partial [Romboutsia sp.]|nr:DUF4116 domain-containing protein [Romboutsia sp.]
EYVKEQTEELCLEAVRRNGLLLEYVREQTPKICLVAVKQNGYALKYVKEQTEELCLAAVKKNPEALQYVNDKNSKICFYAFLGLYKIEDVIIAKIMEDEYKEMSKFIQDKEIEYMNKYGFNQIKEDEFVLDDGRIVAGDIKEYRDVQEQEQKEFIQYMKREVIDRFKLIEKNIIKSEEDDVINKYGLINRDIREKLEKDIENRCILKYKNCIKNKVDEFIKNNPVIKDKVFCIKNYYIAYDKYFYVDINSLNYLNQYLLKQNTNNKYILDDRTELNVLKEISLSNNELIIVDTGYIKEIHKVLANKIITVEDLENKSF